VPRFYGPRCKTSLTTTTFTTKMFAFDNNSTLHVNKYLISSQLQTNFPRSFELTCQYLTFS